MNIIFLVRISEQRRRKAMLKITLEVEGMRCGMCETQ